MPDSQPYKLACLASLHGYICSEAAVHVPILVSSSDTEVATGEHVALSGGSTLPIRVLTPACNWVGVLISALTPVLVLPNYGALQPTTCKPYT